MTGNLLRLRPSDESQALVFVHPASGSAASYRALEPFLTSDRPVYAFHSPDIPPGRHASIERIAEDYLAEFLHAAPRTTPVFVGWSFSGPVAVEMARLSESTAAGASGVVLLDSATPEVLAGRTADLVTEMGGLFGVDLAGTPASSPGELLDRIAEIMAVSSDMAGVTGQDLRPFWDTYRWHQDAFESGWRARPCAAPVLLIRAREETGWDPAPDDLGWSDVFGTAVPVEWAGGTHYTLMENDRLADIARIVERAVEKWSRPDPVTPCLN